MIGEKRGNRRFSGRIGIVSFDDDGLNFGFITDLSREGAHIESRKVPPVGTPFHFILSNGTMRASVLSRVVRSRDPLFEGARSGFGVHFEKLEGLAKPLRDDLLLALMSRRFHAMWEAE
jgi:hypothetical protein